MKEKMRMCLSDVDEKANSRDFDLKYLKEHSQKRLKTIIQNCQDKIKVSPINKSNIPYEHEINLSDKTSFVCKPRVLPQANEKEIFKQIDDILEKDVIEISYSTYASPIVPVVKRDGTSRLCCDYRLLKVTHPLRDFF